jgi:Cu(I)/Ag(I) efflux system membrane protein CusA/SilA
MIAKLIEFSVRNKLLVMLLTVALIAGGVWAALHTSIDAIPDLSDVQVIVITDYPGQAPQVVEDQVTYPLTTALAGVGAKAVRGFSMFETSMVYVIFPDGTGLRDARERVLEYLNYAKDRLPAGVEPKLGPDATGVGWVYQYVLCPGYYDPDHPQGLWHDEQQNRWYAQPTDAPAERRGALVRVRTFDGPGNSPLTGKALVSSNQDLASLRSLQDWYLRYPLTSVPGVAEVASIGGFVKEYQVVLKPERLLAYNLAVKDLVSAVQRSNNDVGGSVVEMSENEYMVRSRGYLHGLKDLATVPVGFDKASGTPLMLGDVATLQVAGAERRGIGEWNGQGEAIGGIVITRYGANAYQVIRDAKAKLAELEAGLPPGVTIKTAYDRSQLIERSIHTLRHTLIEEILVVSLVCILFLLHGRSALVAIVVIPGSVLVSLLAMRLLDFNANIMSLGGIAIAIGVLVDSAIVMVENAHKHLDREAERVREGHPPRPRGRVITEAAAEVGPSLFFSLLIITVSFLPVFVGYPGEEGRLFRPLAFTKTFSMAAAAVLSVTLVPVLMAFFITPRVLPRKWGWQTNLPIVIGLIVGPAVAIWFALELLPDFGPYRLGICLAWIVLSAMLLIPQRIVREERNPISRGLQAIYEPFFRGAIRFRWIVLVLAAAFVASAWWPFSKLGTEFMPPLDEGDLLYMPTTDPSISITTARQVLQQTDKLIATFPEVTSVYGKMGRADTATDPAPLDMVETVIRLKTDRSQWRTRSLRYSFDNLPRWLTWPLHHTFWRHRRTITMDELVNGWDDAEGHHPGMDAIVHLPGLGNLWPMPIENRLKMLSTGIKSPVGLKITGPDLRTLADLAERASAILKQSPDTLSAYPERAFGGYYLDVNLNRTAAARYGLTTGDVQDVISTAIGGIRISTAVEGLERYPINLRYARDLRGDPETLKRVLVPTPAGAQIPLGELAEFKINPGPPMIRSEGSRPETLVYVVPSRDVGSYVPEARRILDQELHLPAGYSVTWSGEFEQIQERNARLTWVLPLTLLIIVVLLYLATHSLFRTIVVLLAVPFSLVGAVWLLWLLGYHLSGAVWVGVIALAGLDAETGLVMLLYLDNSYDRFRAEGRMRSEDDLWHAVHDGAVKRIRPKTMTVAAAFVGLAPLLWATGTGADVMRRLAAPMLGGLFTSFLMELLIYPVIFYIAKSVTLRRATERSEPRVAITTSENACGEASHA